MLNKGRSLLSPRIPLPWHERSRGSRSRQLKITLGYAMPMNEPDAEIFGRDQSRHQVAVNGAHHEENDRMLAKQEVINEAEVTGEAWTPPNSTDTRRTNPSGSRESPELSRKMSRTEAVRQDVMRLKSATLDRMGKMFRARTPAAGRSFLGLDTNVTSVNDYDEKKSRKEKTNSLGRMLKLVDKDGSPRKLFVHPRAGSLSRILRRHPHNEDNGIIDKPAEDTGRGILSRMLSQLRGKSSHEQNYH
ncbi:PREDICTED: uncharacterized protein LOC105454768 isoform X3 [Wasmannia auropunctata]|uniref:uncharacterized protein LOC105454768 isoform X3 n=1 Tax=Wasmannia auropunctata TaxID=64793 RepID=UPI0005EDEAD3|nr:PREDICTED: uncharacterized protein LOC105454768 isoform X3 [Wasmannia auropunctata]